MLSNIFSTCSPLLPFSLYGFMVSCLYVILWAKIVQGSAVENKKPKVFYFPLPSRRLFYGKIVQGERSGKGKAVQSERKVGERKFSILFRTAAGFIKKPKDFTFPLPSRRLFYENSDLYRTATILLFSCTSRKI